MPTLPNYVSLHTTCVSKVRGRIFTAAEWWSVPRSWRVFSFLSSFSLLFRSLIPPIPYQFPFVLIIFYLPRSLQSCSRFSHTSRFFIPWASHSSLSPTSNFIQTPQLIRLILGTWVKFDVRQFRSSSYPMTAVFCPTWISLRAHFLYIILGTWVKIDGPTFPFTGVEERYINQWMWAYLLSNLTAHTLAQRQCISTLGLFLSFSSLHALACSRYRATPPLSLPAVSLLAKAARGILNVARTFVTM